MKCHAKTTERPTLRKQRGRWRLVRLGEHRKAVKRSDPKNIFAVHAHNTQRAIDWMGQEWGRGKPTILEEQASTSRLERTQWTWQRSVVWNSILNPPKTTKPYPSSPIPSLICKFLTNYNLILILTLILLTNGHNFSAFYSQPVTFFPPNFATLLYIYYYKNHSLPTYDSFSFVPDKTFVVKTLYIITIYCAMRNAQNHYCYIYVHSSYYWGCRQNTIQGLGWFLGKRIMTGRVCVVNWKRDNAAWGSLMDEAPCLLSSAILWYRSNPSNSGL